MEKTTQKVFQFKYVGPVIVMRWPTILRDAAKQAKQMRIFPARSLKYKYEESNRKSTHRNPRAIGEHPSGNVHGGQLLEQQLGGVGDVDLRDTVLVVAKTTLEKALLQFPIKTVSLVCDEKPIK